MWKYEPEDPTGGNGGGKDHLKGMQFKYKPVGEYETDNDGNAIFPEPKETPKQEVVRKKIAKTRSKADL
jgi:hypothetical protein